jgi:hypothetical protein
MKSSSELLETLRDMTHQLLECMDQCMTMAEMVKKNLPQITKRLATSNPRRLLLMRILLKFSAYPTRELAAHDLHPELKEISKNGACIGISLVFGLHRSYCYDDHRLRKRKVYGEPLVRDPADLVPNHPSTESIPPYW